MFTVTRTPSPAARRAIADAEFGDDVAVLFEESE